MFRSEKSEQKMTENAVNTVPSTSDMHTEQTARYVVIIGK